MWQKRVALLFHLEFKLSPWHFGPFYPILKMDLRFRKIPSPTLWSKKKAIYLWWFMDMFSFDDSEERCPSGGCVSIHSSCLIFQKRYFIMALLSCMSVTGNRQSLWSWIRKETSFLFWDLWSLVLKKLCKKVARKGLKVARVFRRFKGQEELF